MSTRRFVLDGTNIALVHGRAHPELRYALALCDYLRQRGDGFVCFFDANTAYLLRERSSEQFQVFERVIRDLHWSESLHVVPSGTQADEWILKNAKADGAHVISNDRFRDRARDHRWIWKRRHPLLATGQTLILETLGLEIPVLPHAEDYLKRM